MNKLSDSPLDTTPTIETPHKPHRHRGWGPGSSVILTGFIFVIGQLLGVIAIVLYGAAHGQSAQSAVNGLDSSTWLQFIYILVVEACTITLAALLLRIKSQRLFDIGIVKPAWRDIGRALIAVVVYFALYLVLVSALQAVFKQLNVDQKQDIGFDDAKGHEQLVLVFLSLVVLPPLAEETLFRGFLFTGLRSKLPFAWTAFITSIAFASLHLAGGVSGEGALWIAGIDTFVLSCVLCWLRERSGSIWPGVLLHAIKNGIAFTYLFVLTLH